jgi:hypothetical protein
MLKLQGRGAVCFSLDPPTAALPAGKSILGLGSSALLAHRLVIKGTTPATVLQPSLTPAPDLSYGKRDGSENSLFQSSVHKVILYGKRIRPSYPK